MRQKVKFIRLYEYMLALICMHFNNFLTVVTKTPILYNIHFLQFLSNNTNAKHRGVVKNLSDAYDGS